MNRNSSKATALILCIKKLPGTCNVYVKKWNLAGIWIRSHGKKELWIFALTWLKFTFSLNTNAFKVLILM